MAGNPASLVLCSKTCPGLSLPAGGQPPCGWYGDPELGGQSGRQRQLHEMLTLSFLLPGPWPRPA